MTIQAIQNIFDFAPRVHLLKIEPNDKCPLKGSQWRETPLSFQDACQWLTKGHRLGILPSSANAAVVDIDTGGHQSLAFIQETIGNPVQLIATNGHTIDTPRWHAIYAHDPTKEIGNAKWQGGDLRVDSGYVVMWNIEQWADAIATIAVQEIPPAPIELLKAKKSVLLEQINADLKAGLHPTTLAALGTAIRLSDTWEEAKRQCDDIIQDHVESRQAQITAGANKRATEEKIKSEIASWKKALPQWWAEKIAKNPPTQPLPSPEQRIRIKTRQDNPSSSLVEGLTKMGYQFRTMLYGMRPTYKHNDQSDAHWEALSDGNHAALMIEVADRCYWEVEKKDFTDQKPLVVPIPREKQAIRALAYKNIYDPVKVYLDNLPEWNPTLPSRVFTFLDDSDLVVAAAQEIATGRFVDVSDWAQSYFFMEIVRCTYFPGAQRMPILVLRGKGGEGKSSIGKMVIIKELRKALFSDKFRLSLDDQKRAMICIRNKVLEVPEFGVYRKGDWDEIKASVFEDNAEARLPYGEHITEVPRHDVMYITTNKSNLPEDDPAIHRRFIYVNLSGKAKRHNKVAYYHLDELVDGRHTLRDWLFAEAKYWVMNDSDPENFCMIPDLEPEEWMAFNKMQGGTFSTPGTSFQQSVSDVIDELIDHQRSFVSVPEIRLLVAMNRNGKSIMAQSEIDDKIDAKNITNSKIENAVKADAIQRNDTYYKFGRELGHNGAGPRGFNMKSRESPS